MLRVEVADGLVSYVGGGEGSDLGADPGGVVGPAGVSPGGPGLGIGPVVSGEHWRGASAGASSGTWSGGAGRAGGDLRGVGRGAVVAVDRGSGAGGARARGSGGGGGRWGGAGSDQG